MTELPTEIIIDILTRLPPKPLCRFKSVAKSWRTLISSPHFIKLHLNQTVISQKLNLILCHDSLSTAQFSDTLRFSAVDHPLKYLPGNPTVEIIGTVNGIVCISDDFFKTLILFNPETQTHRLIPPVPSNIPDNDPLLTDFDPLIQKSVDDIVGFGFGYNVDEDDYKLLRMIDRFQRFREVMLYSLRNDSWKSVEDNCDFYPHQMMEGVFFNDGLYFVVTDENGTALVKCFNLKDETFSVFDMFDYDKGFGNCSFLLRELGGCFCVMVNYLNHDEDLMFGWRVARADLWVRKEGSWARLFSVSEPRRIGCARHISPVVYERGGARVLLELDERKLGWYDWKTGKFERVKLSGVSSKEMPFDTCTYVSSLVALKSDKETEMETVKGKSVSKMVKKDEEKEKERVTEKAKEMSVSKKSVNKKNSDGFLSTGFKLRL